MSQWVRFRGKPADTSEMFEELKHRVVVFFAECDHCGDVVCVKDAERKIRRRIVRRRILQEELCLYFVTVCA